MNAHKSFKTKIGESQMFHSEKLHNWKEFYYIFKIFVERNRHFFSLSKFIFWIELKDKLFEKSHIHNQQLPTLFDTNWEKNGEEKETWIVLYVKKSLLFGRKIDQKKETRKVRFRHRSVQKCPYC
jgi:hypothetical protein